MQVELSFEQRMAVHAAIDRYVADLERAMQEDQGTPEGRPGTVGHSCRLDLLDAKRQIPTY